jgi:hypothetical protein
MMVVEAVELAKDPGDKEPGVAGTIARSTTRN